MAMTADAYRAQLQQLLPGGIAWTRARDAVLTRLLAAVGDGLARADADLEALLDEADPRRTYQLLDEWEASAGLPDPCVTAPQTIAERRRALVARLTATGGASADYFIAVARSLGYTAVVTDVFPHVWRLSVLENTAESLFRVGESVVGDRLRTFGNEPLECTINRLKPAHTRCLFGYGLRPLEYTFARNSDGTAFDAGGDLQTYGPNVERVEYDPVTGELLGTLVDGQATNSMPFSEDFSSWARSYGGREHYSPLPVEGFPRDFTRFKPTYIEDPENSSRTIGLFDYSENVGGAGEIWTLSLFVKPINSISTGGRPLYVILNKEGLPGSVYLNLRDLRISGSYESAGIIDCGRGVYRLWATFISDSDDSSSFTFIRFSNRENTSFDPYPTGDEEVAFFGMQAEKGSLSSYIYTDGQQSSRAADFFDATTAPGEQTWQLECRASRDPGEPALLATPTARVYQSGGRLVLDGAGALYQDTPADGVAPGTLIRAYWVGDPGGAGATIGRDWADQNYWNGHLEIPQQFPGVLSAAQIAERLA